MKPYFFLLLGAFALNGADYSFNEGESELTWQQLINCCYEEQKKTDDEVKKSMKEQLLSDLVCANQDPSRKAETKMFIEIITRRMNANNSLDLSKDKIMALLNKFVQCRQDALQSAEMAREAMTITDSELSTTKEALKKVSFTTELNGEFEKLIAPHLSNCAGVPCDASPEELEKKVESGETTEDQIVACMHAHTLAKLLAFVLFQSIPG